MPSIQAKGDKTTIIRKQYHTIVDPKINMSAPIDSEKKPAVNTDNTISTATTVESKPELHSSINPNAEENAAPVYTSENPLMAAPPASASTETQSLSATETPPQRSNPQTEPPTATTATAAAEQQQQTQGPSPLTMQTTSSPKPQKVDFTATDASIQGLLLQVVALQHNKIQQLNQLQE